MEVQREQGLIQEKTSDEAVEQNKEYLFGESNISVEGTPGQPLEIDPFQFCIDVSFQ